MKQKSHFETKSSLMRERERMMAEISPENRFGAVCPIQLLCNKNNVNDRK